MSGLGIESAVQDMLAIARSNFRTSFGGAAAASRNIQSAGISKGRPGFPKPLSSGGRIGLSNSSRRVLNDFLGQSQSLGNAMLSNGVSGAGTIEGLLTQIRAIRAGLSRTQMSAEVIKTLDPPEDPKGNAVDIKT